MENRLEQTTFDRENYKAQLSGNDGRISALESQLARVEAMKNDTEFKLSSLYSILRRSLGLRSGSQSSFSEEDSPKKNRRSFRGRSRSNSGTGTSIFAVFSSMRFWMLYPTMFTWPFVAKSVLIKITKEITTTNRALNGRHFVVHEFLNAILFLPFMQTTLPTT